MGKKIFIGGTGRCGTTILSKYLGTHKNIYKIPIESRFIVDKNGILDLFDGLTTNYCMSHGRMAIKNFFNLMDDLRRPHKTPYLGLDITRIFGDQQINKSLNELKSELNVGSFKGVDYNSQDKYESTEYVRRALLPLNYILINVSKLVKSKRNKFIPLYGYTGVYPKEDINIPKYFSEDRELGLQLNKFVSSLFDSTSHNKGNVHWCEDTPANAFHFDKLAKIFPEAYFLHIIRHPVGVAYSMSSAEKHRWAPSDYEGTCNLLKNMYEKLISIHEYSKKNGLNYRLIKLEDLTKSNSIENLWDFIGLENKTSGEVKFLSERINYYRKNIPKADKSYLTKSLNKYIKYFGYQ